MQALRARPTAAGQRAAVALPVRRRLSGALIGLFGLVVLTSALHGFRGAVDLASVLLLYLALTVVASALGGIWPGALTGLVGFLLADWFFTEPFYSWTVDEPAIVIALLVFAFVAVTVSALVDVSARRAAEATQARSESAALARLAGTLLETDDPLPRLVNDIRATFDLDAVAILRRDVDGWRVEHAAGSPVPGSPEAGSDGVALQDDAYLVLSGRRAPADERRVLTAFTAHLAIALATQKLRREAADAAALAAANRLRTALLSAVSHDLRTPLSSIKASATSLLQTDVRWPAATRRELLQAIDSDADHLNALVGNLLDMSRLQTGGFEVTCRPVGLEEVLSAALVTLPHRGVDVDLQLPAGLPDVAADPTLLERVLANLLDNARKWSPPEQRVAVSAEPAGARLRLRVSDGGPGIALTDRARVFQPFQRLHDRAGDDGVGLGLAVALGFAEAMGGTLHMEDTPGGGTTAVVELPIADTCRR